MKQKLEINYIKKFSMCSHEHFLILKGIAILMVLVPYILTMFFGISVVNPLVGVGSVIFLLCSGYGISESLKFKGGTIHYWENKIIKIWLPSLVALVIGSAISHGDLLYWTKEYPLGLSGWFLYVLFANYLVFWAMQWVIEGKKAQLITIFTISLGASLLLNRAQAEVLLAFPMGMLFSQLQLRDKIRNMAATGRILLSAILAVLAVAGYFLAKAVPEGIPANLCWMVSKTAMGILVALGVYFLRDIPIFGVFAPAGAISFGLYLLFKDVLSLVNPQDLLPTLALAVVILIAAASVFTFLRYLLVDFNKRMRRKRQTHLKGSMW